MRKLELLWKFNFLLFFWVFSLNKNLRTCGLKKLQKVLAKLQSFLRRNILHEINFNNVESQTDSASQKDGITNEEYKCLKILKLRS